MNITHHNDACPFQGIFRDDAPIIDHLCTDCGIDTTAPTTTEWYMVKHDVWAESGMPEEGFLCIGCLERRLGRILDSDDFFRCKLNYMIAIGAHPATARLLHRLFNGRGTDNHFHDWAAGVHIDYTFGGKAYGDEQVSRISTYCDCDGDPDHWALFEQTVRRSTGPRLRPADYDEQLNLHRALMREECERLRSER